MMHGTGSSCRILMVMVLLLFLAFPVWAQDYEVTYIRETYKENKDAGSGVAKVYHTWEVDTDFGKKLLILTGQDPVQRKWLREFVTEYQLFLAKIPNVDTGSFELNTVFEIDLKNLHPINKDFTSGKKKKKR